LLTIFLDDCFTGALALALVATGVLLFTGFAFWLASAELAPTAPTLRTSTPAPTIPAILRFMVFISR
jgi:hypothetical protein